MRLIDPDHRKSGSGKTKKTPKEGKLTGPESPHKAVQVQRTYKCQFFRGSLEGGALELML